MTSTRTFRAAPLLSDAELEVLVARLGPLLADGDPIEAVYPLSPVQEGMLYHTIAMGAADVYAVQQRLEIEGTLDAGVFQQAWSHVVARHPALRTVFAWDHDGPPVQVVCRSLDIDVPVRDLTTDPTPEAIIAREFEVDRTKGFELDRPALMRVVLYRLAPDRHVMLWSQHHLLQDGWSASNVLAEVFAAYEALAAGQAPDLPAVRPFSDYIEWLGDRGQEDAEAFWRSHFAGFAEATRMVPPQPDTTASGFTRRFRELTPDLTRRLRTFAADNALSLNAVLVGALAVALGRYTGKRDVACGFVASGRPPLFEGVEAMVGMFINTLVLRVEIDDRLPVADFLASVQARQAEALEHEHSALTDVQAWSGLPPGATPTDALFAYWNFGGAGVSPSGALRYRTVDGYGRTSFPFSVTVESADPINIGLDFDRGDLEPAKAEQFLEHYATLLGSIAVSQGATVGGLRMLTESEHQRLDDYNDTARPVAFSSVVEAFSAQAAATPDDPAVVCGEEAITYAELDRRSDRVAETIIQVGGFSARRVAIHLPRSIDLVVATLGVLKSGAAYVPIDRHLPPDRIAYLLGDSGADLVVSSNPLRAQLPDPHPEVVLLPLEAEEGEPLDFDIPVGSNDLAYVMYTSGSTGRPKGVMVTHGGLANYVGWAHAAYGDGGPVTFPLYTSVGFDLTVTSLFAPLVSGGHIVVYPDDDARDLAVIDVFEEDRVDVVKLTPSHLSVLEPELLRTQRIGTLVLGGEDLRSDLASFVHRAAGGKIAIYNEYGPTEATVGCMIHRYDPVSDGNGSVPIGRPAPNNRVHLLDRAGAPVPQGVIGEIWVGGAQLAAGYLGRPDLTDDVFVTHPSQPGQRLYRTGDLGMWRRDGVLEYSGRVDDQVKLRGHRIEPGEIEAVLVEHPAVAAAAVAVREPSPGDVRLVAYYVAEPTVPANVTDLRSHLRERLPDFMVTRHLVRIDELPLTPNGKLDRDALPETIGEVASSHEIVAPRTEAEALVVGLSAELLGADHIGVTDNFFELGGHSILAMQLIAKLHAATGVRISPRVILLNNLEHAAALLPGEPDGGAFGATAPAAAAPSAAPAGTLAAPPSATATTAYFFGASDAPLFGMHYAPTGTEVRDRAVLLCPPLGWEYMRTHWAMRKIARRLAREGFHVLRFDYHGTGDSSGTASDVTIGRWLRDIAAAAAEIEEAAGVETISVVGVRLGATLASLACSEGLGADHLVLWDPVTNGHAYLEVLQGMHAEMLAERRRGVTRALQGDELLGSSYPPQLRKELEVIDLAGATWPAVPTTIVASQPRSEYETLARSIGRDVRLDYVFEASAWDELASSQASLLPVSVPDHIVSVLGGSS